MFSVLVLGPAAPERADTWSGSSIDMDDAVVARIRIGQSTEEVSGLLGAPEIVAPTGTGGEIWSYLYSNETMQRALSLLSMGLYGEAPVHKHLTVTFAEGRVLEVNYHPSIV